MVKAIERKAVDSNSVREIAYTIPPIIGPRSNPKSIRGLEDLGREGMRLAIVNPYSGKGFLNLPFLLMESLENKKRYRKLFPFFGFRHTSIPGEPPYYSWSRGIRKSHYLPVATPRLILYATSDKTPIYSEILRNLSIIGTIFWYLRGIWFA
jgi:hypothetical protein